MKHIFFLNKMQAVLFIYRMTHIYIYIYIQREREREREMNVQTKRQREINSCIILISSTF